MKNFKLSAIFGTRKFLALMALVTTVSLAPATASAGGSLHLDLPGFSLGLHDRHGYRGHRYRPSRRHYHKQYRGPRHYRGHRNGYRGGSYYTNNHYYYNDNSYSGYRAYRPRTEYYTPRTRRYTGDICPMPGFSTGYDDDRGCYAHKDHFHCDT